MSQFKFHNDMNNLLNLDGELKMQSKPRWQRKMESSMNGSVNASKLSISYNNSYVSAIGGNTTTAGQKTPNKSVVEAGCSKKKTPNEKKSPGNKNLFKKIQWRNLKTKLFYFRSQNSDTRIENTIWCNRR